MKKTDPQVALNQGVPKLALSRREAAQSLGICVLSLDRLVGNGQLRPARVRCSGAPRGRVLFSVSELERFLRETSAAAVA